MSDERFGDVLKDLLIENGYETRLGAPDWMTFAKEAGLNYESLRKAVVGDRKPHYELMERVAEFLTVKPDTFVEYRLRQFDPKIVGLEVALENLQSYSAGAKKRR